MPVRADWSQARSIVIFGLELTTSPEVGQPRVLSGPNAED